MNNVKATTQDIKSIFMNAEMSSSSPPVNTEAESGTVNLIAVFSLIIAVVCVVRNDLVQLKENVAYAK